MSSLTNKNSCVTSIPTQRISLIKTLELTLPLDTLDTPLVRLFRSLYRQSSVHTPRFSGAVTLVTSKNRHFIQTLNMDQRTYSIPPRGWRSVWLQQAGVVPRRFHSLRLWNGVPGTFINFEPVFNNTGRRSRAATPRVVLGTLLSRFPNSSASATSRLRYHPADL